tara:strand:- start:949 stop:1131 length:183 start_codon:yes stop_codon:yes gene_type:complete
MYGTVKAPASTREIFKNIFATRKELQHYQKRGEGSNNSSAFQKYAEKANEFMYNAGAPSS